MPEHHHHFYDNSGKPAILVHDHDFENVRHVEASVPAGLPIYWDHEVVDEDGGLVVCRGLKEQP